MRKIIAIDGGGTKTQCILVDETGKVLAKLLTEGSNYDVIGIEKASTILSDAVDALIKSALSTIPLDDNKKAEPTFCRFEHDVQSHEPTSNSEPRRVLGENKGEELAAICMGLSGLDFPADYVLMQENLRPNVFGLEAMLYNDSWIALAAGEIQDMGAISICGTGHNTGVMTKDGTLYGINAMGYQLGGYGGGPMLSEYAWHRAFRSFEKTGAYTKLEETLPGLFGQANMAELLMYIVGSNYVFPDSAEVPKLVAKLADEGDEVCVKLLHDYGKEMGEMTGRLIKHAGLGQEEVPVILAGSVHTKMTSPILNQGFEDEVKKYCPGADVRPVNRDPVFGAAYLAIREITKEAIDVKALFQTMDETFATAKEVQVP